MEKNPPAPASVPEVEQMETYSSKTTGWEVSYPSTLPEGSPAARRATVTGEDGKKSLMITPEIQGLVQGAYQSGCTDKQVSVMLGLPEGVWKQMITNRPKIKRWIESAKTSAIVSVKSNLYKATQMEDEQGRPLPGNIKYMYQWLFQFGGEKRPEMETLKDVSPEAVEANPKERQASIDEVWGIFLKGRVEKRMKDIKKQEKQRQDLLESDDSVS